MTKNGATQRSDLVDSLWSESLKGRRLSESFWGVGEPNVLNVRWPDTGLRAHEPLLNQNSDRDLGLKFMRDWPSLQSDALTTPRSLQQAVTHEGKAGFHIGQLAQSGSGGPFEGGIKRDSALVQRQ